MRKRKEMVKFFRKYYNIKPPSIYRTEEKLAKISGLKPQWIDCCINSCMAYTGVNAFLEQCPHTIKSTKQLCNQRRYFDSPDKYGNPKPRRRFLYLPVEERLRSQFAKVMEGRAQLLSTYRAGFDNYTGGPITDVFCGELYQKYLRKELGLFTR